MRRNLLSFIALLLAHLCNTPAGASRGILATSADLATNNLKVLVSLSSSIARLPSSIRLPKLVRKSSSNKEKEGFSQNDEQKQNSKKVVPRKEKKLNSSKQSLPVIKSKRIKKVSSSYKLKWHHSLTSLFQFLTFQNTKYREYIRILKTQILDLQRQIRLHQEEIKQLREKLQVQQKSKRTEVASNVTTKKKIEKSQKILLKKYELEIKILNERIEKMTLLQEELETILEAEQEKVLSLEEENEQYQKEIETLQHRIVELHSLQKDTLSLVEQERKYFKQKIKEEQQKVEEERQKGLLAVQQQKEKMRKLVKAIAMKEKHKK